MRRLNWFGLGGATPSPNHSFSEKTQFTQWPVACVSLVSSYFSKPLMVSTKVSSITAIPPRALNLPASAALLARADFK